MSWIRTTKRGPPRIIPSVPVMPSVIPSVPIMPPAIPSVIPSAIPSVMSVPNKIIDDTKPIINNSIWGPALWLILHSACEQIGVKDTKKQPQEESRIWLGLLQRLRYSLPCPQCKKHYNSFFIAAPIAVITRDSVRRWLFHLHNQVNQRLEKQWFPEESLKQYNTIFNFSHQYEIVQGQMLAAVRQGWSSHDDVQQTLRFLLEMKCFYDFV